MTNNKTTPDTQACKTADEAQAAHFEKLSGQWWDSTGPFAKLQDINKARTGYILQMLEKHCGSGFAGMSAIEVGCGGGLVCEPLAKAGLDVTGIDPTANSIETARTHSAQNGLEIDYMCMGAESFISHNPGKLFDVVLSMDVIEHVRNPAQFTALLAQLVKPGGFVFMSTINRTLRALALAKVAAEYVLGWVPQGTHSYDKFVKPSELSDMLAKHAISIVDISGITLDVVQNRWKLGRNVSVNYIVTAQNNMTNQ